MLYWCVFRRCFQVCLPVCACVRPNNWGGGSKIAFSPPSYVHLVSFTWSIFLSKFFPSLLFPFQHSLVPRLSVGVIIIQWIKSRMCRPMKEPCTHKLIGLQPCLASSTAWPQLGGERETRWGREGGGVLGEERGRRSYKTKSHIESESILSPCPGAVEVSTTMVRVELSRRMVAGFG